MTVLRHVNRNDKGQGLVEYGLILVLVSIVVVGSLGNVGERLSDTFDKVTQPVFIEREYTEEDIVRLVEEENYIPISTPDELVNIRIMDNQTLGEGTKWAGDYHTGLDKNYILVSDINLGGIDNWEPLGSSAIPFTGVFDGGGYVISNLVINQPSSNYIGFFGKTLDSLIENIGLEDVNIKGRDNVGGLIGYSDKSDVRYNYVTGNINGSSEVGGLIGTQNDTVNSNNHTKVDVIGNRDDIGGLVGVQFGTSTTDKSFAIGNVEGVDNVGGLFGRQHSPTKLYNSYSSGTVTGTGVRIGGLVGYQGMATYIDNSYTMSKVMSSGEHVGAFVGRKNNANSVIINNSGWDKDINRDLPGMGYDGGVESDVQGLSTIIIKDLIKGLSL